uniref:Secreted protein n=1 Tax=Sander lucioperca TaxID=283035 RepID=A0A8D0D931_SANLU
MGNCLHWPLRTVGLFSVWGTITPYLSQIEMGQTGYLGPYQESIVSMTQNCVLMSNIRLQTCVFLSKGMATCRQAVPATTIITARLFNYFLS